MTKHMQKLLPWCLAYNTCSTNVHCCRNNDEHKEMPPGHVPHQVASWPRVAPPVSGPCSHVCPHSTGADRATIMCQGTRDGGGWWDTILQRMQKKWNLTLPYIQDMVSTNEAGLSPREQGNIGKKAKQRGLKLQALNKGEDSAGWGKEVRHLPQSCGRGTFHLMVLSELRPFCNLPQTCQDSPHLDTN